MKIRRANEQDFEGIAILRLQSSYDPPKTKKEVIERLKQSAQTSEIYIAEEENKILAYLVLTHKRKFSYLNYIEVSENAKGKGVGRNIMEFFETEGKNNGSKILQLAVYAKNIPAVGLYTKSGFY